MPWVAFEPTVPVFEKVKTVHALDRAATVSGEITYIHVQREEWWNEQKVWLFTYFIYSFMVISRR
jgi:hypothetical protein